MQTYTVSTYDSAESLRKDGTWTEIAAGVSLWDLRPIVRDLRKRGYSHASIRIEESWPRPPEVK